MWVSLCLGHHSWACRISSKGLCMDVGGGVEMRGGERGERSGLSS